MDNPLHALILGIVQGLTEFIPVSSSAHLILVPWMLGWGGPGLAFNVALQVGTLVAVFIYFWKDLFGIAHGSIRSVISGFKRDIESVRMLLLLAIGSVPAAVIGYIFENPIDNFFHSGTRSTTSLLAIVAGLVIVGLILIWADSRADGKKQICHVRMSDAFLIGIAQSLALMPGVSRSGITITAALLLGFARSDAARFSFLLSVPVILGAGLLEFAKLLGEGIPEGEIITFLIGMASSAVVGYLSIAFLIDYLKKHSIKVFAFYRIALAAVILLLLLLGR
ncbi:undecaprenol kinase [Thermobaculum terrenum ATCC BAA-798]|uniref:Undecaprenyl-diphosphatase n=1 Tax=Thermobaculum terrenum (strain ATCC BAA-798 / CCMEE 7001 / YNP1) TaxID=525904 RepID=D1CG99_THET1|nr:undecaprenyl-diphosphatase UppP [Thermobaculum terrenum]ACZ41955.1 undecaprenol kinase [Thermobaculum terrenum ATCC BAA-798]